MPSLKDLKNRIASVKATQKITKAMQMVAAAKLRRAQEAAEAARPYAQRMAAVLSNIAEAVGSRPTPAADGGTGKDDVHLLIVCTAERGLCGGFNSQSPGLPAIMCAGCWRTARRSRSCAWARRATTSFVARILIDDHRPGGPARSQEDELRSLRNGCRQGARPVRAWRIRRLHAVLFGVQVGDQPSPGRTAADPGQCGCGG
jgi:hypothetical protein